jgi:hypothetical protein
MADVELSRLSPVVAERTRPFLEEILRGYPDNIHSIHIVGSALTKDYAEKTSDINSVFVLNKMDLKFVRFLAPLGRKYKKKGIAAPLTMTPEYIGHSLDVFPIEFLGFRLIHETVFGEDILAAVEIKREDLRHQCEREVKTKLISLRQGYISSLGHRRILTDNIVSSITGYMPLFRGIIFLMGKEPPTLKEEVLTALSAGTGSDTDIFKKILHIRRGKVKLSREELDTVFEEYYAATERIGKIIDELQA